MIEFRDVRFTYADSGFALHVAGLSVAQGQRVAWVGPSGSGKTTLLHLVAGIVTPSAGRVQVCGQELTGMSDAARRNFRIANIGLVFQDFALLDYLSVLDNILFPFRINRSLRLEESVRSRARELAGKLGLEAMLSRRPSQLSQGERQRVAVCRALIARPKLLLADEPTANLDPDNANHVLNALDDYAAEHGATLVMVTHDRDLQARFGTTTNVSRFCKHAQPEAVGDGSHG